MEPRTPTDDEITYWTEREERSYIFAVIGGPEEGSDVIPCPTILSAGQPRQCHVAYTLNEIELAALAQGGTLWLSTWGGLPIHRLEVVPSVAASSPKRDTEG